MLLPCDRPCKQTNRHTLLRFTLSHQQSFHLHILLDKSVKMSQETAMFSVRRPREVSQAHPAHQPDALKKNTKRITDTRSSRSQCISHTNAYISYEEIKFTNRIHTSALHSPTCAILTNVTCAWTTSSTSPVSYTHLTLPTKRIV